MEIAGHKIKAAMVAAVALGIGIGIPMLVWIQSQNSGGSFKGDASMDPVTADQTSADAAPAEAPASDPAANNPQPETPPLDPNQTSTTPDGQITTRDQNAPAALECLATPSLAEVDQEVTWTAPTQILPEANVPYLWSGAVTDVGKIVKSKHDKPGIYTATVEFGNVDLGKYKASCSMEVKAPSEPVTPVVAEPPAAEPPASGSAPESSPPPSLPQQQPVVEALPPPKTIALNAHSEPYAVTVNPFKQQINYNIAQTPQPETPATVIEKVEPTEPTLAPLEEPSQVPPLPPQQKREKNKKPGEPSKCRGVNYPIDSDNHPGKEAIRQAYDLCIFHNDANGGFHPDEPVMRIDAIQALLKAAKIIPQEECVDNDCGTNFADLESWMSIYVRAAWTFGVFKFDKPSTAFLPQDDLSRGQAIIWDAIAFGIQPHKGCWSANCGAGHGDRKKGRPDKLVTDKNITMYQGQFLRELIDREIMTAPDDGKFEPDNAMTRADFAELIVNTARVMGKNR